MGSSILLVAGLAHNLLEKGILGQMVLPPLQLDLHQTNGPLLRVLDDLGSPDPVVRGQLVFRKRQSESLDHPLSYFFHEVERDVVLREADAD